MSKDTQVQTFTGKIFDFLDLENNIVDIEDIAHSLGNQCRWTGHTKFHYSIAQHSIYAYRMAQKFYPDRGDIAFEALMHDASEYVLIDLSRPLKLILPDYVALQTKVEAVIARKFGFPEIMTKEVREIDDRLLVTEYQQLFNHQTHPNLVHFYLPPYPETTITIDQWNSSYAIDCFLKTYWQAVANKSLS